MAKTLATYTQVCEWYHEDYACITIIAPSINGKICAYIDDNSLDDAEVYDLYIGEKFRNQGYGQVLLDKMEKKLKKRGVTRMIISVNQCEPKLLEWYEKQGWSYFLDKDGKKATTLENYNKRYYMTKKIK